MPVDGSRLEFVGASVVLRGAYTATLPVLIGDALKVTGEWRVASTEVSDDEVVGVAFASAAQGQPVDVVVAGLARIIPMGAVARGDVIVPSGDLRGKGRKADKVADLLSGKGRKYAVATETKPAGKPVWVQLKTG